MGTEAEDVQAEMMPMQDAAELRAMTERDDFLSWVKSTLYEAELAVHNGDAGPRRAL